MRASERQLLLDLPLRTAYGREDFLVSPSNAAAVAMIDQWPNWPSYGAILTGPSGSGKSHLAEVFRQKSGAMPVKPGELGIETAIQFQSAQALVVDHLEKGQFDERALFHLLNGARQQAGSILLTMQTPPTLLEIKIPDLASRLNALPCLTIAPPDDALLRGVLVKHFVDRQIAAGEQVIAYMVQRMPRSLDAARGLVALIDRLALAEKAEVTRPFVARVMAEFESPVMFDQTGE
jgi:chromosomal replication initiation ATPase DnaA